MTKHDTGPADTNPLRAARADSLAAYLRDLAFGPSAAIGELAAGLVKPDAGWTRETIDQAVVDRAEEGRVELHATSHDVEVELIEASGRELSASVVPQCDARRRKRARHMHQILLAARGGTWQTPAPSELWTSPDKQTSVALADLARDGLIEVDGNDVVAHRFPRAPERTAAAA